VNFKNKMLKSELKLYQERLFLFFSTYFIKMHNNK